MSTDVSLSGTGLAPVVPAPKLLAQPLPSLDGWTHQTESIETVVTKEAIEFAGSDARMLQQGIQSYLDK